MESELQVQTMSPICSDPTLPHLPQLWTLIISEGTILFSADVSFACMSLPKISSTSFSLGFVFNRTHSQSPPPSYPIPTIPPPSPPPSSPHPCPYPPLTPHPHSAPILPSSLLPPPTPTPRSLINPPTSSALPVWFSCRLPVVCHTIYRT